MRVKSTTVRAIVTGASSGIGAALARELSAHGCQLILTARREDRLKSLAAELAFDGSHVRIIAGDISMSYTLQEIRDCVASQWQGVDLLIHCAGIGAEGEFRSAAPEEIATLVRVNLLAPMQLTQMMLPYLEKSHSTRTEDAHRGHPRQARSVDNWRVPAIVNVGSVLGYKAVPFKAVYSATKFGIRGFSDALRLELQPRGIRVLHVAPSTTQSAFFENLLRSEAGGGKARPGMLPTFVAKRVIRSLRNNTRDLVLPWTARAALMADRFFPGLSNLVLSAQVKSLQRIENARRD